MYCICAVPFLQDSAFDPSKSSTVQLLSCQHDLCQCGSPGCSCVEQKCYYSRHYAEMSSSEGWLVLDKLQFPDKGSSLDFVFGCENKETGAIYAQSVDGVLGMGNNMNSFPRQLARSGLVDDVFSLCYGFPKGGSLLLGDVPLDPEMKFQYTPLLDSQRHYYNVDLRSISLNGKSLAVIVADYARGYGAVLDSGTTFTYLPTSAFNAFVAMLCEAIRGKGLRRTSGADPQYNDICWKGAPADFNDIDKYFPTGSINFGGTVSFKLTPQRYLFTVGHGEYCLGMFDNGYQGTLIGGIIVRNILVQYDKKRSRVGFAEVDCNNIPKATAAAQSPTTAAQAADGSAPAAAASSEATDDADTYDKYAGDDSPADASSATGSTEPQQQQGEQQQQSSTSQADTDDDHEHPGRQQTQHTAGSSSSNPEEGDSSSGEGQRSSWIGAFSKRDVLIGFAAGAVVVAVVVQGVSMYMKRRRRHAGNDAASSVAAEGVRYKEVRLSELDIETELTPLADHATAAAAAGAARGGSSAV
eukprot:GHUV01045636.1.p1 GENE.GHUV01045636.1~~GHUV01045636.1.p1  ORF type:complete len:526 (+),score=146.95 GHUV01045636.1:825-2402(+)